MSAADFHTSTKLLGCCVVEFCCASQMPTNKCICVADSALLCEGSKRSVTGGILERGPAATRQNLDRKLAFSDDDSHAEVYSCCRAAPWLQLALCRGHRIAAVCMASLLICLRKHILQALFRPSYTSPVS